MFQNGYSRQIEESIEMMHNSAENYYWRTQNAVQVNLAIYCFYYLLVPEQPPLLFLIIVLTLVLRHYEGMCRCDVPKLLRICLNVFASNYSKNKFSNQNWRQFLFNCSLTLHLINFSDSG